MEVLHKLFYKIWDTVQTIRAEGWAAIKQNKGDTSLCSNHRDIMLLSVPDKILNRVILERLKGQVDRTLRDKQVGFR